MSEALRFFPVDELPEADAAWNFGERLAHHLQVLRKRAGDKVILFDPQGRQALVEISALQKQSVACRLIEFRAEKIPAMHTVLILALTKGKHFDIALRMAVELGVSEVQLLQAQRSVLKWDAADLPKRTERIQALVGEAARQSELARIPQVRAPVELAALLAKIPAHAQRILCSARKGIALPQPAPDARETWIAIGPEGDFSPEEEQMFEESGFTAISLGPTILRVDTAVAAALALMVDRTYWRTGHIDG